MAWLKLTSKALYLMDETEYLQKSDLTLKQANPEQYTMELPLEWFKGASSPGEMIISLKSSVEPIKKVLPPAPRPTRPQIRITKTGTNQLNGLADLEVALMKGSKKVDFVFAVSGAPDRQAFRLPSASNVGSEEPLPEGVWDLGLPKPDEMTKTRSSISKLVEFASGISNNLSQDWPSDSDGLGPIYIEMTCRTFTERSAIGFHVDNNSSTAPGTVGCVGIKNDSSLTSLKKFISWFDKPAEAPQVAVVDWGLGSV
jgi:hypothetical protein